MLVVVNRIMSTVARDIFELKCCSTNSEKARNVISGKELLLGAAATPGKWPMKRMIDHGDANTLPIIRHVIQRTRQRFGIP